MTTSLVSRDKTEAKKKGLIAAVGWGTTAALMIGGFPVVMTVAAAGGSGYLTYKWFMYRAKRGMRF
jgi:hypothetical protein